MIGDPVIGGFVAEHRAQAMICAALREDFVPWAADADPAFAKRLVEGAGEHGVCGLLVRGWEAMRNWPEDVRSGIRGRAAPASFWEVRHRPVLRRLIVEMESRGISPVFIKGTALAYGFYPEPELRARADSDILVLPRQRADAQSALLAAGFTVAGPGGREVFTQQRLYSLVDAAGFEHLIDLHWQINDSAFLSRLFPTEEVIARSVPLAALAPSARAAGKVDLLLLSCVHRDLHCLFTESQASGREPEGIAGRDPGALIWLYDLRVLAGAMTTEDWRALVEAAFARGLAGTCGAALARARALLGAPCPDEVLVALSHAPRRERPAEYLAATTLRRHWMDFVVTHGARRKARFLREFAIPSRDYMRRLYSDRSSTWLSWLYIERAVSRTIDRIAAALRH